MLGCSTLDVAKGLIGSNDGLEVNTELVVGDKEEQTEVQVGDNQVQEAETITNNVVNELDKTMLVLLILGWLLPSPNEMWKGFVKILPWSRK